MPKKIVIEIIVALFVLLFAYAGLSKIVEYNLFKFQLGLSPWPLLANMAPTIAWALPAAELLLVVILTIPKTRLIGLWLSFITMLVFSGYIGILLVSGVKLPCTCGGLLSFMRWNWHLVFNIGFTLLALTGIILQKKIPKPTDPLSLSV